MPPPSAYPYRTSRPPALAFWGIISPWPGGSHFPSFFLSPYPPLLRVSHVPPAPLSFLSSGSAAWIVNGRGGPVAVNSCRLRESSRSRIALMETGFMPCGWSSAPMRTSSVGSPVGPLSGSYPWRTAATGGGSGGSFLNKLAGILDLALASSPSMLFSSRRGGGRGEEEGEIASGRRAAGSVRPWSLFQAVSSSEPWRQQECPTPWEGSRSCGRQPVSGDQPLHILVEGRLIGASAYSSAASAYSSRLNAKGEAVWAQVSVCNSAIRLAAGGGAAANSSYQVVSSPATMGSGWC